MVDCLALSTVLIYFHRDVTVTSVIMHSCGQYCARTNKSTLCFMQSENSHEMSGEMSHLNSVFKVILYTENEVK